MTNQLQFIILQKYKAMKKWHGKITRKTTNTLKFVRKKCSNFRWCFKQPSTGPRIVSGSTRPQGKSPSNALHIICRRTSPDQCTQFRPCWSNASEKTWTSGWTSIASIGLCKLTSNWPNCALCPCVARILEGACRKSPCSGRKWSSWTI